jgi:hypothetical protein
MNKQNRQETVITIKNRDIPKLQRVVSLMQDIRMLEERAQWTRERMVNITQHLSWASGNGEPRGLDAAYAALSGLETEHQEAVRAYARELKAAERILNSIGSPRMRTFVMMMYVLDLPPRAVRNELNMTEWGFKRARQAVEQAKSMDRVVWREKYIFGEGNT